MPGLDTFADLAAIPVDLMRGDYMSALFDLVGVIPLVGEAGDTAKLARMGIKAAETAGDVIDAAKAVETADDVYDTVKAVETADDVVDAAKAVETAGDVVDAATAVVEIPEIPKTPTELQNRGWKETTSTEMKRNTTSRTFKKDDLTIRFDKGKKGAGGYGEKDHYHILNPKSTGKHDYYLDKYGNPVPKNSKASHIIP